ncbi:MAG: ABC transporter permease, partial [Bacteroidales bacterium]|nr:ABC transporter permease [Bacteroidales bacterium]
MYHLKIFLRNLRRDGIYSFINIGGLAIGMAAAAIIMLWVYQQWSYDRFHAKSKHLHKVWCYDETNGNFANVSYSIGPSLINEYAGFANMSRYSENEIPFKLLQEDAGSSNTVVVAAVDTSFLNMFSFPLLRGDASTALHEPNSIVLTQSTAQRLFGDKDPMDESLLVFGVLNFKVTGILADLPNNTGFRFEVLISYAQGGADESWFYPSGNDSFGNRTFVELLPGVDVKAVNASIRDIVAKHTDNRVTTETYLQPLSKWHLYNRVEKGVS